MADKIISKESERPGLCWVCGQPVCHQWEATRPVAVLDCRAFIEGAGELRLEAGGGTESEGF